MLAGFGLSAFLSPRVWGGAHTVYPLGLFILFLGCGLLFALADAVSPAGFWAGLCTFSFGLGVALPAFYAIVSSRARKSNQARVQATFSVVSLIGVGSAGLVWQQHLFNAAAPKGSFETSVGFAASAAVAGLAFALYGIAFGCCRVAASPETETLMSQSLQRQFDAADSAVHVSYDGSTPDAARRRSASENV